VVVGIGPGGELLIVPRFLDVAFQAVDNEGEEVTGRKDSDGAAVADDWQVSEATRTEGLDNRAYRLFGIDGDHVTCRDLTYPRSAQIPELAYHPRQEIALGEDSGEVRAFQNQNRTDAIARQLE